MTGGNRRAAAAALAASAAACIAFAAVADADDHRMPELPKAKGERCVEPTEVMRRRHMEFILHQRDETVHRGIRTQKHRFVNCIDCHVQRNASGDWPRHTDDDHFCSVCHRYAGVSMDCFQCHADRPQEAYRRTGETARRGSRARLSLRDLQRTLSREEPR